MHKRKAFQSVTDIPAGSLLFEDWEDVGLNGWSQTGTADPDYATGDRAGGDGEVAEVDGTSGSNWLTKTFSGADQHTGFFDVEFDSDPALTETFFHLYVGASIGAQMRMSGAMVLSFQANGGTWINGLTFAVDTHYRVWWQYDIDTGVDDGRFEVWVSTTDTKPESSEGVCTDGTRDGQLSRVYLYPTAGLNLVYYDRIRID